MWVINEQGNKEFCGGKEDYKEVAQEASECLRFRADDEDEWVTEEVKSCYNCRWRRWTEKTFECRASNE